MYYIMTQAAEESSCGVVKLTTEEAKTVNKALKELNQQISGWCGHCSIDLNNPYHTREEAEEVEEL